MPRFYGRLPGHRLDAKGECVMRKAARPARRRERERIRGRREQPISAREKRRLRQLIVSAALLLTVVGLKLAAPSLVEQHRGALLELMGSRADLQAAFSAVGRAVSGQGAVGEALTDAYTAVFGPQTLPQAQGGVPAEVCTAENTPEDVCLTQQVLGFAYAAPLTGTITDGFGLRQEPEGTAEEFHYGLDIAADEGTVIRCFADGTVTAVGESAELGSYVVVRHENGFSTLYAHCSRITASSGQQLRLGDPLAEVGQTGHATGPHLHLELLRDNVYLNPWYYCHDAA